MAEKIVLLAFDGLSKLDVDDKETLQPFKLDHYTSIKLGDRDVYFTSELFTDLITGYTRQEHGITGLNKLTPGKYGLNPTGFETWMQENLQPLFASTKNFRDGIYQAFLGSNRVKWEREDIQTATIFDYYKNTYQGQVPVYDWRKADPANQMKLEHRPVDKYIEHVEEEWVKSKSKFWDNFNNIDWNKDEPIFYMHHFHYIDWLQHVYRYKGSIENTDSRGLDEDTFTELMEEPWKKSSSFIKNVKKETESKDLTLVIMSDHGVPMKYIGHKPNAFISCSNEQLLPEQPSLQQIHENIIRKLEPSDKLKNLRDPSPPSHNSSPIDQIDY